MEYLLSYSWVILVVLIGGIALWKMGVFTPQVPERGKVGFSGIDMVGWAAFTTDQLFMSIKNDVGVDVKVPQGGISADIGAIKCDKAVIPPEDLALSPGQIATLVANCSGTKSISTEYKIGEYYEGTVEIEYINMQSGNSHKSVGRIYGPVEGPTNLIHLLPEPWNETTTTTIGPCDYNYRCAVEFDSICENDDCIDCTCLPACEDYCIRKYNEGKTGPYVDYCNQTDCVCTNLNTCGRHPSECNDICAILGWGNSTCGDTACPYCVSNGTTYVCLSIIPTTTTSTSSTINSTTTTTVTTTIMPLSSLNCTGNPGYDCTLDYRSIWGIRSINAPATGNCGENITIVIEWLGWHFMDPNYWGFFINTTQNGEVLGSCRSELRPIDAYQTENNNTDYFMNYRLYLDPGVITRNGMYEITVTGDDTDGYCKETDLYVDAINSFEIDLRNCESALVNVTLEFPPNGTVIG